MYIKSKTKEKNFCLANEEYYFGLLKINNTFIWDDGSTDVPNVFKPHSPVAISGKILCLGIKRNRHYVVFIHYVSCYMLPGHICQYPPCKCFILCFIS